MCVNVCVCVCMCVCVCVQNNLYALCWHIHIVHSMLCQCYTQAHTHIPKPFEDSKPAGLKVDTANPTLSLSEWLCIKMCSGVSHLIVLLIVGEVIFRELTSAAPPIYHTHTHTHRLTHINPLRPSPMWLTVEWLQLNLCGSGQQYTAAGVWPSWHFLGRRRDAGVCDPSGRRSEGPLHFATGSLQSGNKVWSEIIMISIVAGKAAKLSTISLSPKVQAEKGALQTYREKVLFWTKTPKILVLHLRLWQNDLQKDC